MTRILIVGESWFSTTTHTKGFDHFTSTAYETGVTAFKHVLEDADIEVVHLPSHEVAESFPFTVDGLSGIDVLVISDIGANTFLLSDKTWTRGEVVPNRLAMIKDWVLSGGGLMMAGGYMSFQGIDGRARYHGTEIESVLPVQISTVDDRVEVPEGVHGVPVMPHDIVEDLDKEQWPPLLGYNKTTPRAEADVVATVGPHPLLAVMEVGLGRSLVWTSDIAPHWCPDQFAVWEGYGTIMRRSINWLAKVQA